VRIQSQGSLVSVASVGAFTASCCLPTCPGDLDSREEQMARHWGAACVCDDDLKFQNTDRILHFPL
jgi:hypothetical protein